ncbi:MAG: UDP-N-acetylglucosamine 2-epimerase (non-hydrolyzing) [Rhizobiaceae bacterium]|nr:UDP-N-acetylglucosamine 2-epimerase (non-hydrolyzing) [Rhizobiaceae bacterium]
MKILTIIGARPQFIKATALSLAARARAGVEEVLLHTGQHYDENMSEVFFRDLRLPEPKYRLEIGSGLHGEVTGKQLAGVEQVLLREKPDICLVYGDTNSTLAGALAAAKLNIPVAHIEAGLRSFNQSMPEEINRVLTDHVAHWLFTPTHAAALNLKREGIPSERVHRVGDVMYDTVKLFNDNPRHQTKIVSDLGLKVKEYAVATIHRQANVDDPKRLTAILSALGELGQRMTVIMPMHPRTSKAVAEHAHPIPSSLDVVSPLGFFDMMTLVSRAALVVTDSGGLQKEAYFHRVPCVTAREETEWVELVEMGWNRLPGAIETDALLAAIKTALDTPLPDVEIACEPYGGGTAAIRILDVLTMSA